LGALLLFADQSAPPDSSRRTEAAERSRPTANAPNLNLLGTDAAPARGRRNENLQFNLIDNNALKEAQLSAGTNATIVSQFQPERNDALARSLATIPSLIHLDPRKQPRDFHGGVFSLTRTAF
jgi:hypothetical protein